MSLRQNEEIRSLRQRQSRRNGEADEHMDGDFLPDKLSSEMNFLNYTVRKGDTLWSVAERFRVPLEQLLKGNPEIAAGKTVLPGQELKVPLPERENTGTAVNGGMIYYVKKGDTLNRIAGRFGLTASALKAVNPVLGYENNLNPGVQLYLPGYHYVREGENMFGIAASYGVAPEDLFYANPEITQSNHLQPGTRIAIPRRPNGDIAGYIVRPGDTLYKIAQKYNLPVDALIHANPDLKDVNLLCPGELLVIPGPHLARKGQTYQSIAAVYGIPEAELRRTSGNQATGEPPLHTTVHLPAAEIGSCRSGGEMGLDYTVKAGDTMADIAELFALTEQDLRRENSGFGNGEEPQRGQLLHIPIGLTAKVCYRCKKGDTLWSVAECYGIEEAQLTAANPKADYTVGDLLVIPLRDDGRNRCSVSDAGETSEVSDDSEIISDVYSEKTALSPYHNQYPEIYIAHREETVADVAKRFSVDGEELCRLNRGISGMDTPLTAGQEIIVAMDEKCCCCPWFVKESESLND